MPRLHLTDVVVQRLHSVGIYYDETTPAFGIRIGKHRKAWVITKGKDRQRITLGLYPSMRLADARQEAKKRLVEEPVKGSRITFDEAYELYKPVLVTKKPRTQSDYKRALEKFLQPVLGKKRLPDIEYETITAITDELSLSGRRNTLAVGRTFFRWCVKPPRRYIKSSPLEGVELPKVKKRKRTLDDTEIPIVWRAAQAHGYPFGTICQLLLLTGQRRGEIAGLRRPWINEKERTITLPESITKNSKEHTFAYGDVVAEVLQTVPRWNETDLLFPSKVSFERPLSGWGKYKKELGDGLARWTLHDLRRTYRSIHGQIGTPSEIAERLINHAAAVQTDVEAIYDRWHYLPQMRQAVSAFETHFKALLAAPT
ncbi:MAG: tyrosine-type recombinase/integrase [Xanthobacteraceae bacterium]